MRLAHSMRLGAWVLIGLNLLMSFGSIWVFMRMSPAIEIILDQNVTSLQTCEEMLASLIRSSNENKYDAESSRESFVAALNKAQHNITEDDEPDAIKSIKLSYIKAFEGDTVEIKNTVDAILRLGSINREAMVESAWKARQFGTAGAWGIVFMATAVFLAGILFVRSLKRNLTNPLEEIHSVTTAMRNGDTMRRCTGTDLPKEVNQVFSELNEVLDRCSIHNFDGYFPQKK